MTALHAVTHDNQNSPEHQPGRADRDSAPADGPTGSPDGDGSLPGGAYEALRSVAAAMLRRERPDHTLQPTALVHEAFLRLRSSASVSDAALEDEHSFRCLAAATMRRILVDHARRHRAGKRGGGRLRVELPEASIEGPEPIELLALDEALGELSRLDERKARVVELRFFGGLSGEETARVLGISRSTAESDWIMARAWLRQRLGGAA